MLYIFIALFSFCFSVFSVIEKSDSINDESDDDGSDSVSYGMYSFPAFPIHFEDSIVSVCGLESGVFVPTGVESKCDILAFFMFVPIGVKSIGGRLIKMF